MIFFVKKIYHKRYSNQKEKEFIENIVFVKDGRLSMEISIDLNDPYKSIEKYLEINF